MTGPQPGSNRINVTSLLAGFALGAVLASLAWVQVVPEERVADFTASAGGSGIAPGEAAPTDGGDDGETQTTRVIQRGGGGGDAAGGGGGVDVGEGVGGDVAGGGDGPAGGGGLDSAPGVGDDAIQFGATYVAGGLACDFLCEVRDAMEAVQTRVNSEEGGVHGRKLLIDFQDDEWDPQLGLDYIENLVEQDVFAFAVSPSSEGLNAASEKGVFRDNQVPVVGADGLNNSQFIEVGTGEPNQWIWPVATATTTNVHIIMKNAWERSGSTRNDVKLRPAIVFGNTYKFGVEGAYAFNQAYKRLSGQDIEKYAPGETSCKPGSLYCGIPGEWSGGGQTSQLKDACEQHDCNFILILLEPATALNWMQDFRIQASDLTYGMAGAQPLFTDNFAGQCGADCADMWIWTGYKPARNFSSEQPVIEYTQALRQQNPSADINNQFTMGGYIGMELLVDALDQAGRDLTRRKLVDALNSLTLETGLTAAPSLSWSTDGKYANNAAHGFRIKYNTNQGTFDTFERATEYETDDWLGEDNQLP